jgi:hypothetical protein
MTLLEVFMLCHPQSVDLLPRTAYNTKHARIRRISCGTTKMDKVDFSEAGDFHPTYAPWNSSLFETSVILTLWEHIQELAGDDNVAIIHSDIDLHFKPADTWKQVAKWLKEKPDRAVGLTAPSSAIGLWDGWEIPPEVPYRPKFDPMKLHSFDHGIRVWDIIRQYDPDIHEWAMDTQPRLVYSHQFACSRKLFDKLGSRLYEMAQKLRLRDVGFWTPHMFERLIALYLAKFGGEPVLSTCFWHYSSSGAFGPGELSLYGPRPRRYYKITTRWNREATDGKASLPTPSYSPQPGRMVEGEDARLLRQEDTEVGSV